MGLALLDVADVIRPHPDVVAFSSTSRARASWTSWPRLAGGLEARDAIRAWLDTYGMRCVGEIDITRPRWSERPTHARAAHPRQRQEREPGRRRAALRAGAAGGTEEGAGAAGATAGPADGERKAAEVKSKIDRVRTFIGYREYPKYGMVSRYFVYKQALLEEAERLVEARVLREKDDIFSLRFE